MKTCATAPSEKSTAITHSSASSEWERAAYGTAHPRKYDFMPVCVFQLAGSHMQHDCDNALALVREHGTPSEVELVERIIDVLKAPEDVLISGRMRSQSQQQSHPLHSQSHLQSPQQSNLPSSQQNGIDDEWVVEILQRSSHCLAAYANGKTWNHRVNHPVLERAVRTPGRVQVYSFDQMLFPEKWRPRYNTEREKTVPIIDFAYYLDSPDRISGAATDESPEPVTKDMIDAMLRNSKEGSGSVNFFVERALDLCPVGVFVKTNGPGGQADDADAQLEYWASSWHIRAHRLLTEPGRDESWILIPMIRVYEDSWTLRIARYVPAFRKVMVARRIDIGGTASRAGIYRLMAVLEVLVNWMGKDFHKWFSGVVEDRAGW